jgi:hypothetical protein
MGDPVRVKKIFDMPHSLEFQDIPGDKCAKEDHLLAERHLAAPRAFPAIRGLNVPHPTSTV